MAKKNPKPPSTMRSIGPRTFPHKPNSMSVQLRKDNEKVDSILKNIKQLEQNGYPESLIEHARSGLPTNSPKLGSKVRCDGGAGEMGEWTNRFDDPIPEGAIIDCQTPVLQDSLWRKTTCRKCDIRASSFISAHSFSDGGDNCRGCGDMLARGNVCVFCPEGVPHSGDRSWSVRFETKGAVPATHEEMQDHNYWRKRFTERSIKGTWEW